MNGKRWRWLFPPLYGLCIYASIRLVNDVISDTRFWERHWSINAWELGVCFTVSYVYFFVLMWLLRKRLGAPRPASRELLEAALYVELISTCSLIPLAALTDDGCQWYDIVNLYLIPLLYWLLFYAFARGNAWVRKSYEQQLLIEQINNDRLQTELRFLKAQYHPHFLFNALNTVYFQMDDDVPQAKRTITSLSDLLRYQLYDRQQTVPVYRELQHLDAYIGLQRERMNAHLRLEVSFSDQLNDQPVYPLLLLPLVENAFKYAGGDYWIKIEASLENGQLVFKAANAKPPIATVVKDGGIGLENLRRRLALLYPGRHSLDTDDRPEAYSVTLKIQL
ncbi:sensor histidine kinase [Chitinophaga rhizosphaerae]|uniref:sensor histidine kinase n=1 Tax=Chitinophaga rhizosphaerae TaxID=1864947 RepID=UPI000F812DAC|nr:sensor histidine kinase [Chitinophaga rhizosphaerae]